MLLEGWADQVKVKLGELDGHCGQRWGSEERPLWLKGSLLWRVALKQWTWADVAHTHTDTTMTSWILWHTDSSMEAWMDGSSNNYKHVMMARKWHFSCSCVCNVCMVYARWVIHMCLCVCTSMHMFGGQRRRCDALVYYFQVSLLESKTLIEPRLSVLARMASQPSPPIFLPPPPTVLELKACCGHTQLFLLSHPAFNVDFSDWTLILMLAQEALLSSEPYPQLGKDILSCLSLDLQLYSG